MKWKILLNDWRIITATCAVCVLMFIIYLRKIGLKAISNPMQNSNKKFFILPTQTIRVDTSGNGNYGEVRKGHKHQGIDLLVTPGTDIKAPLDGKVIKIGLAYADDKRFNSFHIELKNGVILKLLYVKPLFKVGDTVKENDVIATSQNIAGKYGGSMKNHVHVELLENGKAFNPTAFFI